MATHSTFAERRDQIMQQPLEQVALAAPSGMFAKESVHPYVGFVERTRQPTNVDEDDLVNYGFGPGTLIREPKEDEVVIGVFGGSVAYFFVRDGGIDALWEELQKDPTYAGKTLRLVATGTPGFKQPQQLMALNYLLSLGAHFDIIVNIDGFNEVALPKSENVERGTFAFFPRNWSRRVDYLNLDPKMRLALHPILQQAERRQSLAQTFQLPLLRHSMTASLLWNVLDVTTVWQLKRSQTALSSLKEVSHDSYVATGPVQEYEDDDAFFADLVEVWQRSSQLMHSIAGSIGAEYIHVLQPNQYVENSKPMTEEEKAIALNPGHPYQRDAKSGYPKLQAAGKELAEEGVHFYDLTMIFQDTEGQIYRDWCCHYNERGNEILGRAIGRAMDRRVN